MFASVITYLNEKITLTGYFNSVLCLAEKIEREGKIYPAIYSNNNEYQQINLDSSGSVSYWRKNGDVSISEEENQTNSCGVQYKTTVPLKLVGFVKKEDKTNDAYFSDIICQELIGILTTNNAALKSGLKAKKATITAKGYVTDRKKVASEEYDNIDYEPNYAYAYFSIDFDLTITSNSQCYVGLCN